MPNPIPNPPLTLDRILATAEDVIRRFGPAKATVVDVARALGVSHAAVYRYVATKAELREARILWYIVLLYTVGSTIACGLLGVHHDLLGPATAEYLDDHPVQ